MRLNVKFILLFCSKKVCKGTEKFPHIQEKNKLFYKKVQKNLHMSKKSSTFAA